MLSQEDLKIPFSSHWSSLLKSLLLLFHYHFHSSLPLNIETLNTTRHTWIIPHTLLLCYRSAHCSSSSQWAAVAFCSFTGHWALKKITALSCCLYLRVFSRLPTSVLSVCVRLVPHPPTQKPGRHTQHSHLHLSAVGEDCIPFFNAGWFAGCKWQHAVSHVFSCVWLADDYDAHTEATVG